MKNKMTYLSAALAFVLFTSCKKSDAQATTSETAQTEEYKGKEIGTEHDAEIDKLIAQMTIEEKIGMLHGNSMFANTGVKRLGIPELKMADGPLGVREEISRDNWAPAGLTNDFATYYPAG